MSLLYTALVFSCNGFEWVSPEAPLLDTRKEKQNIQHLAKKNIFKLYYYSRPSVKIVLKYSFHHFPKQFLQYRHLYLQSYSTEQINSDHVCRASYTVCLSHPDNTERVTYHLIEWQETGIQRDDSELDWKSGRNICLHSISILHFSNDLSSSLWPHKYTVKYA